MGNNHWIWRMVSLNYADLESNAPTGFEPVVHVHVIGADAPIPIRRVETSRTHPWVLLYSLPEGGAEVAASDWLVFVPEDKILRVEIAFQRKTKAPIGFTYEEIENDAEPMVAVV